MILIVFVGIWQWKRIKVYYTKLLSWARGNGAVLKIWNYLFGSFWANRSNKAKAIIATALVIAVWITWTSWSNDNSTPTKNLVTYEVNGKPSKGIFNTSDFPVKSGDLFVIERQRGTLFHKTSSPIHSPKSLTLSDYFAFKVPGEKHLHRFSNGDLTTIKIEKDGVLSIQSWKKDEAGILYASAKKRGDDFKLDPLRFRYRIVRADSYQGPRVDAKEIKPAEVKEQTDWLAIAKRHIPNTPDVAAVNGSIHGAKHRAAGYWQDSGSEIDTFIKKEEWFFTKLIEEFNKLYKASTNWAGP